jgi:hypothetical protein
LAKDTETDMAIVVGEHGRRPVGGGEHLVACVRLRARHGIVDRRQLPNLRRTEPAPVEVTELQAAPDIQPERVDGHAPTDRHAFEFGSPVDEDAKRSRRA